MDESSVKQGDRMIVQDDGSVNCLSVPFRGKFINTCQ